MDKEELLVRKALALSEEFSEIKKRLLAYMIEQSKNTTLPSERFQWWLMLLRHVDEWVSDCDRAIEKAKKKEN